MRPRRTPASNQVFRLLGGTEDNDLWVQRVVQDGQPIIRSVWELDDDERAAIAKGAHIRLHVFGDGTPPVALDVVSTPLGAAKAKPKPDGGRMHG